MLYARGDLTKEINAFYKFDKRYINEIMAMVKRLNDNISKKLILEEFDKKELESKLYKMGAI